MRSPRLVGAALGLSCALVCGVSGRPEAQRGGQRDALLQRIRLAEDARASDSASLAPIMAGLRASDAGLRSIAVRALGRFERPQLITHMVSLLRDTDPNVRSEAAQALAQTMSGLMKVEAGSRAALLSVAAEALRVAAAAESNGATLSVIAHSVARLPYRMPDDVGKAEEIVIRALRQRSDTAALTRAALAAEALVRLHNQRHPVTTVLTDQLLDIASANSTPAYAQRVAAMALSASGRMSNALVDRMLGSRDAQMRRLLAAYVAANDSLPRRSMILDSLSRDPAATVRVQAVRTFMRRRASDCSPLLRAATDREPLVAIAAVDLLADVRARCPDSAAESAIAELERLAAALVGTAATSGTQAGWEQMQRSAHALVSLARLSPSTARPMLRSAMRHPAWVARTYAVRAAALLADTTLVVAATRDAHQNVRSVAVPALSSLGGHAHDSVFVRALGDSDYHVVMVAAAALQRSPNGASAVPALVASLARITAQRRETSRDARVALLDRIRELGSAALAEPLAVYLTDYDPDVANLVADMLGSWTGRPHSAHPQLLEHATGLPDVRVSAQPRLRFSMAGAAGGGVFEIELFSDVTPFAAHRILQLAREGYYNGLTFHRIVANFVAQGGSPGANEYVGDGPFMRDEVSLVSQERGTVGVSTRGRDTGDAQIYINLIDNPRLDFSYTTVGRVIRGMETVDRLLEGDIIARVDVIR